jgi:molybdopterin converting factor small subunit
MKVRLQLFAAVGELAGCDVLEFDLAAGSSIGDLRRELVHRVPALAVLSPHLMFALDAEYASDATVIGPAAEVACIPPVSGG